MRPGATTLLTMMLLTPLEPRRPVEPVGPQEGSSIRRSVVGQCGHRDDLLRTYDDDDVTPSLTAMGPS